MRRRSACRSYGSFIWVFPIINFLPIIIYNMPRIIPPQNYSHSLRGAVGYPLVLRRCRKRLFVKRARPAVEADTVPHVCHYLLRVGRYVARGAADCLAVNVPRYAVLLPVECVLVKVRRGVKPQVVEVFVPALTVCVVVELHLRHILAEYLYVNLVPRAARICEEGGYDARTVGRLHAHGIEPVAECLCRTVFRTVVVKARPGAALRLCHRHIHYAVFNRNVLPAPLAVEHLVIGPAVGGVEPVRAALGKHDNLILFPGKPRRKVLDGGLDSTPRSGTSRGRGAYNQRQHGKYYCLQNVFHSGD